MSFEKIRGEIMIIKQSTMENLDDIMKIYAYAREQMKKNGNPTQWGDIYPTRELIEYDIRNKNSYIIEENEIIYGVFSFILGEDETYQSIEGKWLNDKEYGTIHRVASNNIKKGIFELCLYFCESKILNIRVDTHKDNKIMQYLLEKHGYQKCGIIHVKDGSPRIAYQKCIK